uniref:Uncharacterized protein n=1 Tax=Aegilops tauschii TaxID=37682 RepID=R7W5S8_AEGTA
MEGLRLWQGFIDILLNAYENGKSWAGNFDDEHLQVSGGEFIIDTEPNELASYANLLLDLARLANLLIRHFVTANQLPPRYIQALYRSLTKPLLQAVPVPSPEEIQNYLKFMRNHPALKPARRTNTFVDKVFQASRAMGSVERGTFMAAVANVQVPLDWFQGVLALGYILLNRTLQFKIGDPNNILCVYRNGPAQVFRFIRNLLEHGSDADTVLDIVPPTLRTLVDACHQKGGKTIFDLVEQASDDTEDCKLEGSPDADNLSQGENKKTVYATGRSYEVQQGRPRRQRRQNQAQRREEQAVVPDRRHLEQYVMMIFLCLLFFAYIWAPIDMWLLGYRPLASY